MQRVARRTRQQHDEEEDISVEDVVDEEEEEEQERDQQPTEVFTAKDETIPEKMSTIANENVTEGLAPGQELGNVDTADNPISLVLANNKNPYIEDIPTPSPGIVPEDPIQRVVVVESAEEEDTVEEEEEEEEEAEQEQHEVTDAWATPKKVEVAHQEDADHTEIVEYSLADQDGGGEEEEEDEVTPKAEEMDEHGNRLDAEGNPILDFSFPDSWIRQEDQGDGIVRFETDDGQVRFIMELGYDFPDPPNEYRLEMDCYLKHIPTTHRLASGCEFFVDNGIWRVQLETEIVNILLRMDIAQDFEDLTGETLWNVNKDVTIENLTRAMTIFKDCTLDDSPVRWALAKDAVYNPRDNVFKLSVESTYENVTRNVSIANGMTLVQSNTTVSIPKAHNTEFHDHSSFQIAEDATFSDKNAGNVHLDSVGCDVEYSENSYVIVEDSILEEQGTRHLQVEGSTLEDQGTRHLICEEGETVDIVRGHVIPRDAVIEDISREFVLFEDAEMVDEKRHFLQTDQKIERTPAVWSEATFEAELVDLKEMKLEMDIKFSASPSKFNLNQIELDDDFLAELGDLEDEEE